MDTSLHFADAFKRVAVWGTGDPIGCSSGSSILFEARAVAAWQARNILRLSFARFLPDLPVPPRGHPKIWMNLFFFFCDENLDEPNHARFPITPYALSLDKRHDLNLLPS